MITAVNCEFGNFVDEAPCDRLLCGIRDEAAQWRLLAEADLNLMKALTLAQSMERAQKDSPHVVAMSLFQEKAPTL